MAIIEALIHCQVDQEPMSFSKSDMDDKTISFAVNLSVDCRSDGKSNEADEENALKLTKKFLGAVQKKETHIELYTFQYPDPETGKCKLKLWKRPKEELTYPGKLSDSGELINWLIEQQTALGQANFWAPIVETNGAQSFVETSIASAGDRLRAAQSWNAPASHMHGLTRIIRFKPEGDVIVEKAVVAVPFFDDTYDAPDILSGKVVGTFGFESQDWLIDIDDYNYIPFGSENDIVRWICRSSPMVRNTGQNTDPLPGENAENSLNPDGFLIVNKDADSIHRLTSWFEGRAASMLSTAAALGPRDATDDELERVEKLCAFVPVANSTDYTWDGAVWYGISRLVAALDNFVIALVQPPVRTNDEPTEREGEILSPLVSFVLDELESLPEIFPILLNDKQVEPEVVTRAIRQAFVDGSPLANKSLSSHIGAALKHVYAVPDLNTKPEVLVTEDSDLVSQLLQHFIEGKLKANVGERLKKYAATTPKIGEALTRALGEFEQKLQSETDAENSILRLLETTDLLSTGLPSTSSPHGKFSESYCKQFNFSGSETDAINLAFERAWIKYQELLGGPFSGSEAVRQAAGSCFTRALLTTAGINVNFSANDVVTTLRSSEYYVRRFAELIPATKLCFDPVLKSLVVVGQNWLPNAKAPDVSKHLGLSFTDVLDPFEALLAPKRFIPDNFPRPLPIQIASNIDGSNLDAFAKAFNGIAVAIRRIDKADSPFAYAHLADLYWNWSKKDAPVLRVSAALHPMLPSVSDGRGPMFIEYKGYPFADAFLKERVIDNSNEEVDKSSPFYSQAPFDFLQPPASTFEKVPKLAYGRAFETFSFVTTNAGTLPLSLQRDTKSPWMPNEKIERPSHELISKINFQRTTAIAEMKSKREVTPNLRGTPVEGVSPLAEDYPRTALFAPDGNAGTLDLFKAKDGYGELHIPKNVGETTKLEISLSEIKWAKTPRLLSLQVHNDHDETPAAEPLIVFQNLAYSSLPKALKISFRLETGGSRFVEVNGVQRYLPNTLGDSCWIRLNLLAQDGTSTCMSFAEINDSNKSNSGVPLITLRPKKSATGEDDTTWKVALPDATTVNISTPRVTYLDFKCWFDNPDKYQAKHNVLYEMLSFAYMMRHSNKKLAELIDSLPDPAVEAIRVDFATVDSLSGQSFVADYKIVQVGGLLDLFVKTNLVPKTAKLHQKESTVDDEVAPWNPEQILELLKILDDDFSFKIKIEADSRPSLSLIEKSLTNNVTATVTATVPAGTVSWLAIHSHVRQEHFTSPVDSIHPPMFDSRLERYAQYYQNQSQKVHKLFSAFPASALRVEVMYDDTGLFSDNRSTAITLADEMIYALPAGNSRSYSLATKELVSVGNLQHWRILSEVEVVTQEWRPSGRPIYSYISPRDFVIGDWLEKHPLTAALPIQLGPKGSSEPLRQFEHEAFFDRPDIDSDTAPPQRLQPIPSSTLLQKFSRDSSAATYFRHRFTLRSRYAGALRKRETWEVATWPIAKNQDPPSESWTQRVVMLAGISRDLLTRPQLRALIPLTTTPGNDGRKPPAPPIAAILQEAPFAQAGLADRICSEIKTGFGYGFENDQPAPVEILDSRKEVGTTPYLTYEPLDAATASGMVLITEGPMGLTFDTVDAPAPAFPNTMLTLRPTTWLGKEPPLEELMLGITMTRYIDPNWAVGVWSKANDRSRVLELDPERAWVVQLDVSQLNNPGPLYNDIGKGVVSVGTPTNAEKILFFELKQVELKEQLKNDKSKESLSALRVCAYKLPIDGVDTTQKPIEIALIDRSHIDAIYLLHQPLAAGRYVAKVLARSKKNKAANASENIRQGLTNLPVVLASFEWSTPKEANLGMALSRNSQMKSNLIIDGRMKPEAFQTNASAPTYHKWTRTSRDFDFVNTMESSQKSDNKIEWALVSFPISELTAQITGNKLTLRRGQFGKDLWLRSSISDSRVALEVHRHRALITSKFLNELGKPVEKYVGSSNILDGEGTVFSSEAIETDIVNMACRIVEFETPARPLCNSDLVGAPSIYKFAKFDLFSTGFAPSKSGGQLRFFFRFLGSSEHLKTLKKVTISMCPDMVGLDLGSKQLYERELTLPNVKDVLVVGIYATVSQPTKEGTAEIAFEFLTSSGSREIPIPHKEDLSTFFNLTKPSPHNPGLFVEIKSSTGSEFWTDVSLLHSASVKSEDDFDFDWLFSPTGELSPSESVKPFGLNKMVEAQARIVSVSTPIPIRNWT